MGMMDARPRNQFGGELQKEFDALWAALKQDKIVSSANTRVSQTTTGTLINQQVQKDQPPEPKIEPPVAPPVYRYTLATVPKRIAVQIPDWYNSLNPYRSVFGMENLLCEVDETVDGIFTRRLSAFLGMKDLNLWRLQGTSVSGPVTDGNLRYGPLAIPNQFNEVAKEEFVLFVPAAITTTAKVCLSGLWQGMQQQHWTLLERYNWNPAPPIGARTAHIPKVGDEVDFYFIDKEYKLPHQGGTSPPQTYVSPITLGNHFKAGNSAVGVVDCGMNPDRGSAGMFWSKGNGCSPAETIP